MCQVFEVSDCIFLILEIRITTEGFTLYTLKEVLIYQSVWMWPGHDFFSRLSHISWPRNQILFFSYFFSLFKSNTTEPSLDYLRQFQRLHFTRFIFSQRGCLCPLTHHMSLPSTNCPSVMSTLSGQQNHEFCFLCSKLPVVSLPSPATLSSKQSWHPSHFTWQLVPNSLLAGTPVKSSETHLSLLWSLDSSCFSPVPSPHCTWGSPDKH